MLKHNLLARPHFQGFLFSPLSEPAMRLILFLSSSSEKRLSPAVSRHAEYQIDSHRSLGRLVMHPIASTMNSSAREIQRRLISAACGSVVALAVSLCCAAPPAAMTMGPLRLHPDNPRYFAKPSGDAVWLTGSHTWASFQERGVEGQTPDFDYPGYLDFLEEHGHNYIRLWTWEHARWMQFVSRETPVRYAPLPYARTGPGDALDGKPKFDLTQFNPDHFQRLRQRVEQARGRGIYVGVMLFQGFSLSKVRGQKGVGNAWEGHPFHPANNVNGVDGNPSGDGKGHEVHTLQVPRVTELQQAYVRKMIETLGDLDNVLWEIGNELELDSVDWQYHMIRYARKVESGRPLQHPIGMSGAPITAEPLFASPADWISPNVKLWVTDPPANAGTKVILMDNDHGIPTMHHPSWVWKALTRGHQFLLMDGYRDFRIGSPLEPDPKPEPTRRAMGAARKLSERIKLAAMTPQNNLSSTKYCLADSGREYVVYVPEDENRQIAVTLQAGQYAASWMDEITGQATAEKDVHAAGGPHDFQAPAGGAVLHLRLRADKE
jgi:hypothetical protein